MQIGIDLGGTKIEGIALAKDQLVVPGRRIATPRDYEGTLGAIARLVAESRPKRAARGTVGVGIPGVVGRATGLVKNANSVWLNGRPLLADLEARLSRPVRVANDANCFALSEAVDGAGAGARDRLRRDPRHRCRRGHRDRRRIHEGPNQIAGEWGHNPLPWMTDEERPRRPRATAASAAASRRSSPAPASSATTRSSPAVTPEPGHRSRRRRGRDPRRPRARAIPGSPGPRARHRDRRARPRRGRPRRRHVEPAGSGAGGLRRAAGLRLLRHRRHRVVRHQHGDSSGVRGAAWLWNSDPG